MMNEQEIGLLRELKSAIRSVRQEIAGMAKEQPPSELLRTTDAAEFLGCSEKTLLRKVADKKIHRYHVGKSFCFRRCDLIELRNLSLQLPSSEPDEETKEIIRSLQETV